VSNSGVWRRAFARWSTDSRSLMSASLKPNGFPAAIPNHVGFTVR